MSTNLLGRLGKKRKDGKKYAYTRVKTDVEEIHGRDGTQDETLATELHSLEERKSERSCQHTPFSKSVHYLDHHIRDGDTLQKLSLLYTCPVAELKRANRLLCNQEFYALKRIKVPVKKYSILTEILPSAKSEEDDATESEESVRTFNLGIGQVLNGEEQSEAAVFLKKMDEDLARIRESTKLYKDSLEEAAVTLTSPQFKPLIANRSRLPCDRRDCTIIAVIIIFVLTLPLIIILYTRLHESLVPLVRNVTET